MPSKLRSSSALAVAGTVACVSTFPSLDHAFCSIPVGASTIRSSRLSNSQLGQISREAKSRDGRNILSTAFAVTGMLLTGFVKGLRRPLSLRPTLAPLPLRKATTGPDADELKEVFGDEIEDDPKGAKVSQEELQEEETEESETVVSAEASTEAPKADKKKKSTKWKCLDCGAMNFAASEVCDKCGSAKPSKAEADLVAQKAEAQDQVNKVIDSFIRLQADLQNYRRQHDESMSRAKAQGKEDALRKLLPLSEEIEAALVEPENMSDKDRGIFTSYSMLFRKVTDVYAKTGVEAYNAEAGSKFDPVSHVAVEEREVEDAAPGTVFEVLKSGWKCDGRVIVPAEVVTVARPKKEEVQPSADESSPEAAAEDTPVDENTEEKEGNEAAAEDTPVDENTEEKEGNEAVEDGKDGKA